MTLESSGDMADIQGLPPLDSINVHTNVQKIKERCQEAVIYKQEVHNWTAM